jgi:hypothetical protein
MIRQIARWVSVVAGYSGVLAGVLAKLPWVPSSNWAVRRGVSVKMARAPRWTAGLAGAGWVAASPDGQHVYVAAFYSSAVTTFARSAVTGVLTQLRGPAGCVADIGDGVTCAAGRGLAGPVAVVVSPDGKHVYVTSRDANAVAAFARNPMTGALTQLSGGAGCIDETAMTGCTLGALGERGDRVSPTAARVCRCPGCQRGRGLARDATTGTDPVERLGGVCGDDGTGGRCVARRTCGGAVWQWSGRTTSRGDLPRNSACCYLCATPSGALTQISGAAGCIARRGWGACARSRGLRSPPMLR